MTNDANHDPAALTSLLAGRDDVWPWLLLIIVVLVGRRFYYRIDPIVRERFGSALREPPMTPEREKAGLSFLIVILVVATLLALFFRKAFPFLWD